MKTIRMTVDLEYDDEQMHGNNLEEIEWFHKEILRDGGLTLHSNELGDIIGDITLIREEPESTPNSRTRKSYSPM